MRRGDIDDPAPFALFHVGKAQADRMERAGKIDRDDHVPLLDREFLDRRHILDAGIVDHHVDLPEALGRLGDEARDLVRLRFASRELGVTCQTIILEALECYLEANDVAPVSDVDFAAETDRLMRLKKEKARKRRS